jgi:hypothetical protein
MFSPKQSLKLGITCLTVAAIVMTTFSASLTADAQSKKSKYGLGLPGSATASGAVRSTDLPLLLMLAPRDGGRTLSPRPSFYWYIPPNSASPTETNPYSISFGLRDKNDGTGPRIVDVESTSNIGGLHKFSLPASAPALEVGKAQRWDLKLKSEDTVANANALIVLEKPTPEVEKALGAAKTDLDKARVYAKYSYWYDAVDAYSNWLTANKGDKVALQERAEMLSEVMSEVLTKTLEDRNRFTEGNLTSSLNQFLGFVNSSSPTKLSFQK